MSARAVSESADLRLSEVVSALSYALDLVEGQPMGHAVRTCLLGMRLAAELGLSRAQQSALFYAILLKDAGCLTTTARLSATFGVADAPLERTRSSIEWYRALGGLRFRLRHAAGYGQSLTRALCFTSRNLAGLDVARHLMETRCERGVEVARMLGLPEAAAGVIRSLDEHWDGHGLPAGLRGREIPLLARITGLAQTVDLLVAAYGVEVAREMAEWRRGTWFDPALVDALSSLWREQAFWQGLRCADVRARLAAVEPEDHVLVADEMHLDLIAEAFGTVIDAKSPYTYRHSEGVAALAVGIGDLLGFSLVELRDLRRAALLHDIGKLGISNRIWDKRGPLTAEELREVRRHPALTYDILSRVARFRALAEVASSHHERLDGTGYHRGLTGDQLAPAARALAVADAAEALSAERPYRGALPWAQVLEILRADAGKGLCAECVAALSVLFAETSSRPGIDDRREILPGVPLTVVTATSLATARPMWSGSRPPAFT
jgi:HD-GYP domain-containing protein (c-di-GMP phosphodiesterase class II)